MLGLQEPHLTFGNKIYPVRLKTVIRKSTRPSHDHQIEKTVPPRHCDTRSFACASDQSLVSLRTKTSSLLPHNSHPPFCALSPTTVLAPNLIMAANTKYQAAPQRDSFDEPNYTQAPPSYQAAGPSDGLLGAPRGEDDNVPDDFKVQSPSQPHGRLSELPIDVSHSSAAPSPKPPSTSACNSSAKSTLS